MKAYAYIRVSGKGQLDGDGFDRQRHEIKKYAKANSIEIVKWYEEKGVSGTLAERPALAELLVDLEINGVGVKTVIVECLNRLARDLMVQENIINDFEKQGVALISAIEGDDLLNGDPTRNLVRQLLGAVAQYEKTMLVQKLKVARDRKRKRNGKCEGSKPYIEVMPEIVEHIKTLRKKPKSGKRKTYQEIAEQLNSEGVKTFKGKSWNYQSVANAINPIKRKHKE
jgi:DNA invertase Pin-like site-specific DNA recombinase